jgi:hypothetical protein
MTSLCRVIEQMNCEEATVLENYDNSKALVAVRAGSNLRADFWDDFIKVCNQSQSLSELLGVRREVIARWPAAIREALAKIDKQDSAEALTKKASLITTGY